MRGSGLGGLGGQSFPCAVRGGIRSIGGVVGVFCVGRVVWGRVGMFVVVRAAWGRVARIRGGVRVCWARA